MTTSERMDAAAGLVSCRLKGGLGNQLFQIFATWAVGVRLGRRVAIPKYGVIPNDGFSTVRRGYWDTPILEPLADRLTVDPSELDDEGWETVIFAQHHYLRPDDFGLEDVRRLMLDGYFQSYKYFEREFDDMLELWGIRDQILRIKAGATTSSSRRIPEIGLHFRLGDYRHLRAYHPVLPDSYYAAALALCHQELGPCAVVFACEDDDEDEIFARAASLATTSGHELRSRILGWDWEQMLRLATCDVLIIANSTFSWWAAYLGTRVGCPLAAPLYPCRWFGPELADARLDDMFPADWRRVDFV